MKPTARVQVSDAHRLVIRAHLISRPTCPDSPAVADSVDELVDEGRVQNATHRAGRTEFSVSLALIAIPTVQAKMHVRSSSQNSEGKHSSLLEVVADGGACGQERQAGSELREGAASGPRTSPG